MTQFQVGDVVRRTADYRHGNHEIGSVHTVTSISGNGSHFRELGSDFVYNSANYELVSRGPPEKKKSGFGRWIAKNEVPESNT